MTPKFKTRDVQKALYVNFLQRAEECLHAAQRSFTDKEWNAATISAVHCCISASDAMCVFYLGKRHAGETHSDVVALFKATLNNQEINENAKRLSRILAIKNIAEYEERLLFEKESAKILKDTIRFFEFTKSQLP